MSNAYLDSLERRNDYVVCATRKTRTYVEDGTTFRITVTAELHSLGGQAPYFSATCSIDERKRNNRWYDYSGGADHESILKHFPELEPIVALHLADVDGWPMHAVANGLYWFGLANMVPDSNYGRIELESDEYGTWAPSAVARHFRIPIEEAHGLRAEMLHRFASKPGSDTFSPAQRKLFFTIQLCELVHGRYSARWLQEANDAMLLLLAQRERTAVAA